MIHYKNAQDGSEAAWTAARPPGPGGALPSSPRAEGGRGALRRRQARSSAPGAPPNHLAEPLPGAAPRGQRAAREAQPLRPARGREILSRLHQRPSNFAVLFQHQLQKQEQLLSLFHPTWREQGRLQDWFSAESPHREGESSSKFCQAAVRVRAVQKTAVNLAYTRLSHQYALIKRDKNIHLEINL